MAIALATYRRRIRSFSLLCPPASGRPWVLTRHRLGTRARRAGRSGSRHGFPLMEGPAGWKGGDGGVDERVLVGGVGKVELWLGDQGTPDRPEGRLRSHHGGLAG